MQNQKGISTLIVTIIIIAVAVVAVGGVFAYQYFSPKTQPVVQTQQTQNQQAPHINTVTPFVDSNGNTQFSVAGTGFIGSTPFVDGQGATYSASSLTDTSITLLAVKQLDITNAGTHTVYMKNSTTGQQSNTVTFQSGNPTQPSITVTSPNGGETWKIGETHNITWNSAGLDGNVDINLKEFGAYSCQSNITLKAIPCIFGLSFAREESAKNGSFSWTISNGRMQGGSAPITAGNYTIQICPQGSTVNCDESNNYFTIKK